MSKLVDFDIPANEMSQYFNHTDPTQPSNPPPRAAVRGAHRSGLATASMILGILALLLALCAGHILGILAVIFGLIALNSIKKSEGAIGGRGRALTGVILGGIALIIGLTMLINALNKSPEDRVPKVKTRLEMSESNLTIFSEDKQVGFGNTPEAIQLATSVAETLQVIREEGFTDAGGISLSGNRFTSHCEITDETVAFLIHIPKLRKFDNEAKDYLCKLSWMVSQGILQDSSVLEGTDIAVGVRGFVLYEKIMIGKVGPIPEGAGPESILRDLGVTSSSKDDSTLSRFFLEPSIPQVSPPPRDSLNPEEDAASSPN